MHKKGYLLIAMAGTLWGTLGLFGKLLFGFGLQPQLVVFCRLFFGFLLLIPIMLIKNRNLFKIDLKGLKYTAIMGLFTQSLFNVLYFESIKKTTIATAVVLLYTAPIFLTIMGRIFYKEKFTIKKILSLILCVCGCVLTVTGGIFSELNVNLPGVLMGIGAGFNYALVTIISKAILDDYDPLTVIFYSFGFGWIFLIPFSKPLILLSFNYTWPMVISIIGLGFIPSVMSYIFYITGLTYGVEASKAGIISSVEIVVSVIISYIIFGEMLVGLKLLGIVMVVFSVVLVQIKSRNSEEKLNIES